MSSFVPAEHGSKRASSSPASRARSCLRVVSLSAVLALGLMLPSLDANAQASRSGKSAASSKSDDPARSTPSGPIPEACADKKGVQLLICVECRDLPFHRRVACEQKTYWTHCGKGARFLKDSWCGDTSDQRTPDSP